MNSLLMTLMVACRGTASAPAPDSPAGEQATAAAEAASATDWSDKGLKRHMQKHFAAATDGVWYLAHDRQDAMRIRIAELAHAPHDQIPEELRPFAVQMSEVATQWVAAPTMADAARISADLSVRCAACHQASGALPPLTDADVDLSELGPGARHSMAPYLMWVGLVLPSDRAWTAGAANLAKPDSPALATEQGEAFAKLGQWAREATGDERRDVWVELVGSCAGCHEANDVKP